MKKFHTEEEREAPVFGAFFQVESSSVLGKICASEGLVVTEVAQDRPRYKAAKAPFDQEVLESESKKSK